MRKVVILIAAPLAIELGHFNPNGHPHDHREHYYQSAQQSSYVYGRINFNYNKELDSVCTLAWDSIS